MSDLEQFLDFLYSGLEGYVYTPRAIRGQEWKTNFFQWPLQKQELIDWVLTESIEADIYVGPALYKTKSVSKDNIVSSNVVWLEYDGQDIDFKKIPEPDMMVGSGSEGHYHCYWKIPVTSSSEVLEDTNRRLTYYLRADTSGWDATQVLRPPESINHKHGNSTLLHSISRSNAKHDLSVFDPAPAIEVKPPAFVPTDLLDPNQVLKKVNSKLRQILVRENPPVGERSTFLMNCGYQLARAGLSELEAVTLLWAVDNRIKKFVGRSDVLQRLGEIVAIAFYKHEQENQIQGYSPFEVINHADDLDWIIPGWLHRNGIMLLTGQPGVGKTQFALQAGISLSLGAGTLISPTKPVRAAFLSLEMALPELNYIFRYHAKGLTEEQQKAWNSSFRVFPAVDEGGFEAYEKMFEKERPNVVIIDSLSELANDELKENEARLLMKWLRSMRVKYDHAQIIIHHNRKPQSDNKKPNKLSDLYGSFVFAKLSETVLCLWHDEKSAQPNDLELITLKSRFGEKKTYPVHRNDYLLFAPRIVEEEDKNAGDIGLGTANLEDPSIEFTFKDSRSD